MKDNQVDYATIGLSSGSRKTRIETYGGVEGAVEEVGSK